MGRVRAISDEFTFNRYSDFQLTSIVWANQKAFVLVRPTCHFLIKLFCVGGHEGSQATVLGGARALGKRSDDTFMTNAYAPSCV
jgi:hypothetical protein